jgi:hypothetical protein
MVSNLKWRTGFGWTSLLAFVVSVAISAITAGVLRGMLLAFAILLAVWLSYKYYTYNGSPWRKTHFRGMLLYSAAAGKEANLAKIENRSFNVLNPVKEMALLMCGKSKEDNVSAMIDDLRKEQGGYYVSLFISNASSVFPKMNETTITNIVQALEEMKFSPQSVICNIVENTYGGKEATKYILALITKKAY